MNRIVPFSDYLYDKYEDLRYPYVSPMNVEPGSLLLRSPERYDMVLFRRDFRDFLRYTQRSFEHSINCYQPESYGDGVFHPLGVASREHYEAGDPFRAYETWRTVQAHVDRRSREKTLAQDAQVPPLRPAQARRPGRHRSADPRASRGRVGAGRRPRRPGRRASSAPRDPLRART